MRSEFFRVSYPLAGMALIVLELVAVFNGQPGDTISESIWELLDWIGQPGAFVLLAVGAVFQGWFFVHIYFRVWPRP